MFSLKQKRYIADEVQKILKDNFPVALRNAKIRRILKSLNHPEMPEHDIKFDLKIHGQKNGEWQFDLHVYGAESWSWVDIRNNGAVTNPGINPFNEMIAEKNPPELPID